MGLSSLTAVGGLVLLLLVHGAVLPSPDRFVAEDHPEVTALYGECSQAEDVTDALVRAAGSWPAVAACFERLTEEERPWLCALVAGMKTLDLLDFETEAIAAHVRLALRARGNRCSPPMSDEIFVAEVLEPRIGPYEHIADWRPELAAAVERLAGRSMRRAVKGWRRMIARRFRLEARPDLFGPMPDPRGLWRRGWGSKGERTLLAVAGLRALGIPARRNPEGDRVEYWDGEEWRLSPLPGSPAKGSSARPVELGTVRLWLTRRGLPATSERDLEAVGISRWEDGAWRALNERSDTLEVERDGDAWLFRVPRGEYLFTGGVRNANGDVKVHCFPVDLVSNDEVEIRLALDLDPSEWQAKDWARRAFDLARPVTWRDLEGATFELPAALDRGRALLVFIDGEEPSIRMAQLIAGAVQGAADLQLCWIAVRQEDLARLPADLPGRRLLAVPESLDGRGVLRSSEDQTIRNAPIIVLLEPDGSTRLWREGYDLLIGEILPAALQ